MIEEPSSHKRRAGSSGPATESAPPATARSIGRIWVCFPGEWCSLVTRDSWYRGGGEKLPLANEAQLGGKMACGGPISCLGRSLRTARSNVGRAKPPTATPLANTDKLITTNKH